MLPSPATTPAPPTAPQRSASERFSPTVFFVLRQFCRRFSPFCTPHRAVFRPRPRAFAYALAGVLACRSLFAVFGIFSFPLLGEEPLGRFGFTEKSSGVRTKSQWKRDGKPIEPR